MGNKVYYFVAFIIGMLCRFVFFSVYGYMSVLAVDLGFIKFLIDLFPPSVFSVVFYVQDIVIVVISAFISAFVPLMAFGYCFFAKSDFKIYSLIPYIGILVFDLLYYPLVLQDFELMLNNYLPIWHGVLVSGIWIFLFYGLFYFGRRLRKMHKQ